MFLDNYLIEENLNEFILIDIKICIEKKYLLLLSPNKILLYLN